MPLAAGSRLGPYEIVSPLGAGGMGEVYRARDTRLGRDVAIKVLPAHLADRPELRERFDREARLVSSLSHPNICTLHDVGHEGGVDFLVLELLEGETLADRLSRGPLPPEDVIRLGIQIASALDRAHRSGVVHRDLKPGNVMLTRAGVKLLDFGLAKMAQPAADPAGGLTALGSGTRPQTPLTQEGTILGTFQYMAPEQLEGGEADPRTDLFALGAILYEMVTGRKAFAGKSQASLIASIMGSEPPPLSQVAPMIPPAFDRVVRACLAKDPDERIQTAHDVVLQLRWIEEGGSQAGIPKPVVARRRRRERLAWGIAAGAGAVAVALAVFTLTRPSPDAFPVRFQIQPPPGVTQVSSPKISPNGRILAFYGTDSTGVSRIWVHPLDALEAHPLPGTDGVDRRPFWSPDSRYLGYFAADKLRRVDVAGGPPVTLRDAPHGADGSWGTAGIILFDGSAEDTIRSIRSTGGEPLPTASLDRSRGELFNAWPVFLPDGKHFLFNVYGKRDEPKGIRLGTVGSTKSLLLSLKGSRLEYAAPGYLLNVRDGTLMAQPFDAGKRRFTGDPFPVADDISTYGSSGLADFSVSSTGVLVYRQGAAEGQNRLIWVDREGRELGTLGDAAGYHDPALSPDGSRVAVTVDDPRGSGRSIWVIDVSRGVSSRFTFTSGSATGAVWSRDGKVIYFTSDHEGFPTLYAKAADGSGEPRAIAPRDTITAVTDVSPDGAWILAAEQNAATSWDVSAYSLPDGKTHLPLVRTPASEIVSRFSPDGKEIAYASTESGTFQVYVQPFPGPGGKWQVSTNGGMDPHWRGDGRELFYIDQNALYAVTIEPGPPFRAGAPSRLTTVKLDPNYTTPSRYAVTTDGFRFLLNAPPSSADVAPFTVVLDWTAGIPR